MGAKSGREFLQRLDSTPREVWYGGEKIAGDVSNHPAFRGVARSIAALYDMQLKPGLRDVMTYESPTTHEPVGTSFMQPRTKEDLAKRTAMMTAWANYSGGMMGRTAEYLGVFSLVNSTLWSFGPLPGGLIQGWLGDAGLFAFAIITTAASVVTVYFLYWSSMPSVRPGSGVQGGGDGVVEAS